MYMSNLNNALFRGEISPDQFGAGAGASITLTREQRQRLERQRHYEGVRDVIRQIINNPNIHLSQRNSPTNTPPVRRRKTGGANGGDDDFLDLLDFSEDEGADIVAEAEELNRLLLEAEAAAARAAARAAANTDAALLANMDNRNRRTRDHDDGTQNRSIRPRTDDGRTITRVVDPTRVVPEGVIKRFQDKQRE